MRKVHRALRGKVAVVTGGGRGIGHATALALSREGVSVAIADLQEDVAATAAAGLPGTAYGAGLDVSDPQAYTAFLDETEQRLGPIDILINNAGIMPAGLFEQEAARTTERQIAINLGAVLHGTQEGVRRMKPRGTGHIVNVASGAGLLPGPGFATYCATKSAVITHAQALALELDDTGIELSVVLPAMVKTELSLGLPAFRGMRAVTTDEVATEIVKTLQQPKFAVFVPKSVGPAALIYNALPFGVRRALLRAAKLDKINDDIDMSARRDYEARVNEPQA